MTLGGVQGETTDEGNKKRERSGEKPGIYYLNALRKVLQVGYIGQQVYAMQAL